MVRASSLRAAGIAIVASLALPTGAALALDAHSEAAAEAKGARVEFVVDSATVSVQMPCAEPADGPPGPDGLETSVCFVGDRMFIFAASQGAGPAASGPMSSDFDAAYEEVANSNDTDSIEELEVDGRRTMRATRGPEPSIGMMQAIQVAPDALIYAITMSNPNAAAPLSDAERQEMRDFVDSLEVSQ